MNAAVGREEFARCLFEIDRDDGAFGLTTDDSFDGLSDGEREPYLIEADSYLKVSDDFWPVEVARKLGKGGD